MASLLEKVSTLISANLHALVDQALKTNSLAVIDQYIRQVENYLEDLEEAAATVGGEIKTIRRKTEEQQVKELQLDRAVDALLMDGNQAAAGSAQSRLNSTRQLVETYQAQTVHQEEEYQKLLDARAKLQGRLEMLKQQRQELEALLELARSKEMAVKTVKSLDDMLGSGDSDISRIAQGIYARLDKATTATEMRATNLDEQIDHLLDRKAIDAQLADRKARLGLNPPA
jgi:phage shock protein A